MNGIFVHAVFTVDRRFSGRRSTVRRALQAYAVLLWSRDITKGWCVKVFVTGATGVLGRVAVRALLEDGHEVTGLARGLEKARALEAAGAVPACVHLFDVDALTQALRGFDAVCNLATHIPVGTAGLRHRSWRVNDKLRTEGSRAVAEAAAAAGVRRLVQESASTLYRDGGESWLTETSPLSVTTALEPAAVAESNASAFSSASREAVVLRFGSVVGDDPATTWLLERARAGRPIGFGQAESWAHVVHPEDAGTAIAAALYAPGGVYNVGADPVRRGAMLGVFAEIVDRASVGFLPRLVVKLAGERLEPLTRSHRISSAKLHEVTGWKPAHPVFEPSWVREPSTR
jgi:nucleoside-diphosphate-sugar epimerase